MASAALSSSYSTKHKDVATHHECILVSLQYDPAITVHMPPLKPLRREMKVLKLPEEGMGISICTLLGKIYITDVTPGGCGWKMGLRVGDRIDEVNNSCVDMGNWHAFRVKQLIESSQRLKITVADQPIAVSIEICRPKQPDLSELQVFMTQSDLCIVAIDEQSCVDVTSVDKLIRRIMQSAQKNDGIVHVTLMPYPLAHAILLAHRHRVQRELDKLTRNFYSLVLN